MRNITIGKKRNHVDMDCFSKVEMKGLFYGFAVGHGISLKENKVVE